MRIQTVTSLGEHQVRGVGREEPRDRRQGDEGTDRLRPHPIDEPAVAPRFENEINQFSNKKGIIVDIRFNGGGNIDQELIDILERRPYEYWNTRWGSRTWGRRPRQAIAGPKVMMINSRSGSDSEVTPLAFRELGLGRIVGNPTAAAVIATGSYAPDQRRRDPHAGLARRDLRPDASRTTTASTSRTSASRRTCGSRTRPRTS